MIRRHAGCGLIYIYMGGFVMMPTQRTCFYVVFQKPSFWTMDDATYESARHDINNNKDGNIP